MTYYETIMAIGAIKKDFEKEIEKKLKLTKVQSPLFVKRESGLQDDLSGVEKAVTFDKDDEQFEIVHSLAKWKRSALGKYGFPVYTGLYTDMKAIRKDEIVDATHSLYVEQWDWEQVIEEKDRNIAYLKKTVNKIYSAIRNTSLKLSKKYPELDLGLPEKIFFITSQKLEDLYPYYLPEEREDLITKEKRAVFIIGIGDKLKSGKVHDLRSPDYDDWNLNGDLFIYSDILGKAVEVSSMGIRVSEKSLLEQLEKSGHEERLNYTFHKKILKKELPYTIGGGIGQSRVLMLLRGKKHVASVQASSWEQKTIDQLKDLNIL